MLSAALIAIHLTHPTLSEKVAVQYADAIDQQAIVAGVDPLSFVAVIERESKFRSSAISYDGLDYGLMQIRTTYYHHPKNWLFNPIHNIQVGTHIVRDNVKMCAAHLGREPELGEWYACYRGECGRKVNFCRTSHVSAKVQQYRDCLSQAVEGDRDVRECKSIYN
jgi:hypothetical protein